MKKAKFTEICAIMVDALPVVKEEKRIAALYHFFGERPEQLVEAAAKYCAETLDRFPTPKVFREALLAAKRDLPALERADRSCEICDGKGVRSAQRIHDGLWFSFRCRCDNGLRFSRYALWTRDKLETYYLLTNINDDVRHRPEIYRRGLEYLQKIETEEPGNIPRLMKVKPTLEKMIYEAERETESVPF